MATLYIEPELAAFLGEDCGILFIRPLLREVILCFASDPAFLIAGEERRARLSDVLQDELRDAPLEPLRLPMLADRRLRRLADAVLAHPSARLTIEEKSARIGASEPFRVCSSERLVCHSVDGGNNCMWASRCSGWLSATPLTVSPWTWVMRARALS